MKAEKEVSASVLAITSENKSLAAKQTVFDRTFKYPPLWGSRDGLAAGHRILGCAIEINADLNGE